MLLRLCFSLLLGLAGAAFAAENAAQAADIRRRAVTTIATVVSWASTTVTVNPSDPTHWVTVATDHEYPFTTTSTTTSGCVSLSYIFPPPVPTSTSSDTTTTTVTRTIASRTTVTETRTDVPLTTRYSATVDVVSMSTGLTQHTVKCTNTAVMSFHVTTTATSTRTLAGSRTTVSNTEVCMTSTIRWLPGPDMTFVRTTSMPWYDEGHFTPGQGTILTFSEPTAQTTWVTTSTDLLVATTVICNNPRTVTTQTYFTVTQTLATTMVHRPRTDCSSSSPDSLATPIATPAASTMLLRRRNAAPKGMQHAPGNVRKQAETPVGTRTVTYTTTGLLSNGTIATITRTGIVETFTQTLTTIVMVGETITATATSYVSDCSVAAATPTSG
ncbi:hypothetical protein C8A01DRAFT_19468 [Parachaetomium inaequale]|uniref:Uncharacterized protein n=1 Tax=Parachaetomium inaequale TaxID=2588326 RepID=A0AAN6SNC2_9PEZI|nr:hypothetical protein C8A01DRAFT_19468 [Parachaetomium inaequale]